MNEKRDIESEPPSLAARAHALAAALQNMMDAYGDGMDSETLAEGRKALAAYGAQWAEAKHLIDEGF